MNKYPILTLAGIAMATPCLSSWRQGRRDEEAHEHHLHHVRRPFLSDHQRLRSAAHADSQHRLDSPARHTLHRELRGQLPLRAFEKGLREPVCSRASTATRMGSPTTRAPLTAASRPFQNCCSKPATKPASSASGTSPATQQASTIGTSSPVRATTTIPPSSTMERP